MEEVKERVRSRSEVCELARSFYEYNPVCGDDDVTYLNPYILLCFRPSECLKEQGSENLCSTSNT